MPADPLAAAKARIAQVRAEMLRLTDELVDLEAFVEAREKHLALHPDSVRTNIRPNMQAEESTPRRNRRGRPLKSKHPFPVALEAKGLTVTAWADAHGVERVTVKSWYGKGGNRIPGEMALIIEKEMGVDKKTKRPLVPASVATWPNGIRS